MDNIQNAYEQVRESGILPGYAIIAGDRNGSVVYSLSNGSQCLRPGFERPFQLDTICAIASMTKLMTVVVVMQCVKKGLLEWDKPVAEILPEVGEFGIITDFNDETKKASFEPNNVPITLRMLLTHTSGYTYDWLDPILQKWRIARGEIP